VKIFRRLGRREIKKSMDSLRGQGKNVGMRCRKAVESRKKTKKMQKERRGNYGEDVFNVEDNRDKRK
jgi:hypothetical protein